MPNACRGVGCATRWNNEVLSNLDGVVDTIAARIRAIEIPHDPPP